MFWLFIIILAYFFLALASLVDRYILAGPLQSPKAYAFFVGILGILALFLVPFGFEVPPFSQIILSLAAGAIWILAIYFLYVAIYQSEISKIVPAIGGFLPIFTFVISYFAFPTELTINCSRALSLLLLILGSILITFEKEKKVILRDIRSSILAAIFFAVGFLLMKMVYLQQSFISGFIWMRIGGTIIALLFLLSSETRQIIFKKGAVSKKQVSLPLVLGQAFGGLGFVLQNLAVNLAEIKELPLINALEGIRYVFLLFCVSVLGRKFPHLLKEKISRETWPLRIFAILLIVIGLVFLSFE